ncbi:MAG: CHAT domain-containing protein [Crocinitomicaceae bacterium]|nr:CHAT domain-containing protein [Crocinitomicaceae bacterium]
MALLFLIQVFLIQSLANTTNDSLKIVQLIQKGELLVAEKTIENRLKLANSVPQQIFLNQSLGDIKKLEGEMDIAINYWRKSNGLRLAYYGKKHPQITWNYALESNYAYEVWDSPRAKIYADSCTEILNQLNTQQLQSINAHLILNMLGEAYKQSHSRDTPEQFIKRYAHVEELYLRSLVLQKTPKSGLYDLAKTHHKLGNVYHDMTIYFHRKGLDKEVVLSHYQKAMANYKKALDIQEKLHGKTHFERGKTYFVMGLLHQHLPEDIVSKSAQQALHYFEESWLAYGYESNNTLWYESIPNKVDFLMMLKYYTISLQDKFESTKKLEYLKQAESVNNSALAIWRIIHSTTQQSDINQKLSLYWLIPYQEYVNLQVLKLKNKQPINLEDMLLANQKLKYFDILKKSGKNRAFEGQNLKEVQAKLKEDEVFLDYFTDKGNKHLNVLLITKRDIDFVELDNTVLTQLADFRTAILNFDFTTYTSLGLGLYEKLVPKKARNFKKWIVVPDGGLHQLPFEALLVSRRNIKQRDYRSLHYVLNDVEITYAFSTALYKGTLNSFPLSILAMAPSYKQNGLTELPFSQQLVKELNRNYSASSFVGKEATKARFLNTEETLIHLSSHAEINNTFSPYSILHFADDTLVANELNFAHTPRFVVLNTCNSAMGKIHSGDGINGFVRTLLNHGVETVLANIWEVDDKASNQLLTDFYEELHDGNTSHQALRKAKLKCIKNSPNSELAAPFYWAGHLLFGEELKIDEGGEYWWLWVLVGLGVVAGVIRLIVFIH